MRLFESLMRNIDAEDAYKRHLNSKPREVRHRCHRLNIQFNGPEPSLDDASKVPELKMATHESILQDIVAIPSLINSMMASMFYFELDELPLPEADGYYCHGFIYCRLDIPPEGLRYLYQRLFETTSWFIVQGSPVSCVQNIPRSLPPFKRRVSFRTQSMAEVIAMSIRGITSSSVELSGFPTTLSKLVEAQQLYSPFGTVCHTVLEKALPAIKRGNVSPTQCSRNFKRVRTPVS